MFLFPTVSVKALCSAEQGSMYIEHGRETLKEVDDDGREKRTGSWVTASAHIITAVIGSGVLSLAWALAQLGWIAGPIILLIFSVITYLTSTMLADCYRSPDPVTGKRNYTYMDVVSSYLGGRKVQMCGVAQYGNLVGVTIGYTITASISMVAVQRSNCFFKHGHEAKCIVSNYPYMMLFAFLQICLCQIPNFHKLSWLSILAAVMSVAYATIGVGLSIAKVVGGPHAKTTLTGTIVGIDVTSQEKAWKALQAIGNIAFAYAFSTVLIEIQDTLKSSPPENKSMKRASLVGVFTTSLFYITCGCVGYAAFGNAAPGNFLTDFGFYDPFWLVDFANICVAVHLIGAYQVFAQPIFQFVESSCYKKWPENKFITAEYGLRLPSIGVYKISLFRLVWRTAYVIVTAIVAMIFPFFNDFLGLIGAAAFWPLTVYFPVEMHIAQKQLKKFSCRWIGLKLMVWLCLIVSLLAAAASIKGLVESVKIYKPFQPVGE